MSTSFLKELQKRLPPSPGILGRDHYNCSAVLVPVVVRNGEEQLLFEKRSPHIRQAHEICFPGGHFDVSRDSDFLGTALRETREELGLAREKIEILGQLDTLVSPRGIIVECFLGVIDIDDLDTLVLDPSEVADVFTVPIRWFQEHEPEIYRTRVELQSSYVNRNGEEKILLPVEELGLPPRYKDNRSEWMHRVVVYRRNPDIIWGLTAAVVENLVNNYFPARTAKQE